MMPQVMCEHEDGGVALSKRSPSQNGEIFELSEQVLSGEELGRNAFLEEEFIFKLSEQVL